MSRLRGLPQFVRGTFRKVVSCGRAEACMCISLSQTSKFEGTCTLIPNVNCLYFCVFREPCEHFRRQIYVFPPSLSRQQRRTEGSYLLLPSPRLISTSDLACVFVA